MEQKLKERLVGLAVLLLLGIIIIPLVLDGENTQIDAQNGLELPVPASTATHELDFTDGNVRRIDLPVPNAIGSNKTRSTATSASDDLVAEALKPKDTQSKTTDSSAPNSPKENTLSSSSTASSVKSANNSDKAIAVETKTKPGLTTTEILKTPITVNQAEIARVDSDPSTAWVVQVGSFGDRNNAENKVTALKAKGFPAFLSRFVSSDKSVLYRVRVGPEKDRTRAEKLAERLQKAGNNGQVVAHP